MDLADTVQNRDEDGVDSDHRAGVAGLDVTLTEFRTKPLKDPNLLPGQCQLPVSAGFLQPWAARHVHDRTLETFALLGRLTQKQFFVVSH